MMRWSSEGILDEWHTFTPFRFLLRAPSQWRPTVVGESGRDQAVESDGGVDDSQHEENHKNRSRPLMSC